MEVKYMRLGINSLKRARKFRDFVSKETDFGYVENGEAIFYSKTDKDIRPIALKLKANGSWKIGVIRDSCENFEEAKSNYLCTAKRIAWLRARLSMVKLYNDSLPKKATKK